MRVIAKKALVCILLVFILVGLSGCSSAIYLDQNLRKPDVVAMEVKGGSTSSLGIGGIALNRGPLFSFSNKYNAHSFPITLKIPLPSLLGGGDGFRLKSGGKDITIFYSDVNFGAAKGFFSQAFSGLKVKFSFFTSLLTGIVTINGKQAFYFIANPDGKSKPGDTSGMISIGSKEIKIEGINKTDKEGATESRVLYGYQFRYKGKVVAALDMGGKKKIWMKNKLSGEIADTVVAVSSSLIHRKNKKNAQNDL